MRSRATLLWVSWFLWAAFWLGVRFLWLESGVAPLACGARLEGDWACQAKFWLVQAFIEERTGWVSLLVAFAALWRQSLWLAHGALLLATFATIFYSATTGVIAALAVLPLWLRAVGPQR